MTTSRVKVGYAESPITPPIGTPWIVGKVVECIDDLHLKVICFDVGDGAPVLLATADICGFDRQGELAIRQCMAEAVGTSVERVRLNATHNHSAPSLVMDTQALLTPHDLIYCGEGWWQDVQNIAGRVAEEAMASARPAHFSANSSQVHEVASNRCIFDNRGNVATRWGSNCASTRNQPDGLFDPEATVMAIQDEQGEPIVSIVNFACHPTTHGASWWKTVHPEFPGYAAMHFTEQTGSPCFFLQGACGNITPGKYADNSLASAKLLGLRLGRAAVLAWQRLVPLATDTLDFVHWEEAIELRADQGGVDEVTAQLEAAVAEERGMEIWRLASLLNVLRAPERSRQMALFMLRSPSWSLTGLPGESVIESALAIKNASPTAFNLVGAYYDCTHWYLPTRLYYRQDNGYEAHGGWCYAAPGSSEQMTHSVIQRLHDR